MESPSGHNVRYPSEPIGTTVALKLYALASPAQVQGLVATGTGGLRRPLKAPPGRTRVNHPAGRARI